MNGLNAGLKGYLHCLPMLFLLACQPAIKQKDTPKTEEKPNTVAFENGKQLFYSKCSSCHKVNKELTGPALKNAEANWPNKQKLYAFIKNSEAVIVADSYAKQLWLQYNKTTMTANPDLTDTDIQQLLYYIKMERSDK